MSILQKIADAESVCARTYVATCVYLGKDEFTALVRENLRCHAPPTTGCCEHCGQPPRKKVFGLDIYLVDAKNHLRVA